MNLNKIFLISLFQNGFCFILKRDGLSLNRLGNTIFTARNYSNRESEPPQPSPSPSSPQVVKLIRQFPRLRFYYRRYVRHYWIMVRMRRHLIQLWQLMMLLILFYIERYLPKVKCNKQSTTLYCVTLGTLSK